MTRGPRSRRHRALTLTLAHTLSPTLNPTLTHTLTHTLALTHTITLVPHPNPHPKPRATPEQDAYGLEKLMTEELLMHYDADFGMEARYP